MPTVVGGAQTALREEELTPIFDAAIRRWIETGMLGAAGLERLDDVRFEIADLPDLTLGLAIDDTIWIDTTAAGHGWFIDDTPFDDSEFRAQTADGALRATPESEASGAMVIC